MNHDTTTSAFASVDITEDPHRNAKAAPEPGSESLRMRVLVVEDDLVSQRVARRYLEAMGYDVVIADDGKAAVNACTQQEFALVLMDLQMAHMDGLQAAQEIRRRGHLSQRAPILGLTASAARDEPARCTAAGMNGLLIKPLQRTRLSQALEQLGLAPPVSPPPIEEIPPCPAPAEEPVDLVSLRAKFRGDIVFVDRLCQTFVITVRQLLNELDRAAQADERTHLRTLAHKIKGASNNVYAHRTAALAAKIESESTSMPSAELRQAIDALRQAFAEVATRVSSELQ